MFNNEEYNETSESHGRREGDLDKKKSLNKKDRQVLDMPPTWKTEQKKNPDENRAWKKNLENLNNPIWHQNKRVSDFL